MDEAPLTDISAIEARMETLRDEIETCRKAILISRAAIAGGGAWIIFAAFGFVGSTGGLLLAIAACLGGFVGLGSNGTTQREARAELARLRSERDALIDSFELRKL